MAIAEHSAYAGMRTPLEGLAPQSQQYGKLSCVQGLHGLGTAVTAYRLSCNESLRAAIESVQTIRFLDKWEQELERAWIEASRRTSGAGEARERRLKSGPGGAARADESAPGSPGRCGTAPGGCAGPAAANDEARARAAGRSKRREECRRREASTLDRRVRIGDQVSPPCSTWRLAADAARFEARSIPSRAGASSGTMHDRGART
jgi:hypothetical protein